MTAYEVPIRDGSSAVCSSDLHTVIGVGVDRLAGSAGRKMPGSVLLPALMLAANPRHLDAAMPFVDRPERRPRLDGLQLLSSEDRRVGKGCVSQCSSRWSSSN